MRRISMRAKSPRELEAQQDEMIALARDTGEPVVLVQSLVFPPNKLCPICGTKKWKKCVCKENDSFELTFYPAEYRRPSRRSSRLAGLLTMAMAHGWLDQGGQP